MNSGTDTIRSTSSSQHRNGKTDKYNWTATDRTSRLGNPFPKKRLQLCCPNLTKYIFNLHNCWKKKTNICKWNNTEHITKLTTKKVTLGKFSTKSLGSLSQHYRFPPLADNIQNSKKKHIYLRSAWNSSNSLLFLHVNIRCWYSSEALLMSTHNICFRGDKNETLFFFNWTSFWLGLCRSWKHFAIMKKNKNKK